MKWSTKSKYVDIDTGEMISAVDTVSLYRIVKKTKQTTIIKIPINGTRYYEKGINEYTFECRRNEREQGTLFK